MDNQQIIATIEKLMKSLQESEGIVYNDTLVWWEDVEGYYAVEDLLEELKEAENGR